jgi:hypothetical protein
LSQPPKSYKSKSPKNAPKWGFVGQHTHDFALFRVFVLFPLNPTLSSRRTQTPKTPDFSSTYLHFLYPQISVVFIPHRKNAISIFIFVLQKLQLDENENRTCRSRKQPSLTSYVLLWTMENKPYKSRTYDFPRSLGPAPGSGSLKFVGQHTHSLPLNEAHPAQIPS